MVELAALSPGTFSGLFGGTQEQFNYLYKMQIWFKFSETVARLEKALHSVPISPYVLIISIRKHCGAHITSAFLGFLWMERQRMDDNAPWSRVCEIQLDLRTMKLPETPGNVIVGLGTRMQANYWFFLGDIKEQLQRSLHKIEVIKRFSPSAVWKEYWKIRTSVACGEELEAPYCGYNCITSWSDEFQLYRRPKI